MSVLWKEMKRVQPSKKEREKGGDVKKKKSKKKEIDIAQFLFLSLHRHL
jgi:hypothetical protein